MRIAPPQSYIIVRNIHEKGVLLRLDDFTCAPLWRDSAFAGVLIVGAIVITFAVVLPVRLWAHRRLSWGTVAAVYVATQSILVGAPITILMITPIGPLPSAVVILFVLVLALKTHSYVTTCAAIDVEHRRLASRDATRGPGPSPTAASSHAPPLHADPVGPADSTSPAHSGEVGKPSGAPNSRGSRAGFGAATGDGGVRRRHITASHASRQPMYTADGAEVELQPWAAPAEGSVAAGIGGGGGGAMVGAAAAGDDADASDSDSEDEDGEAVGGAAAGVAGDVLPPIVADVAPTDEAAAAETAPPPSSKSSRRVGIVGEVARLAAKRSVSFMAGKGPLGQSRRPAIRAWPSNVTHGDFAYFLVVRCAPAASRRSRCIALSQPSLAGPHTRV